MIKIKIAAAFLSVIFPFHLLKAQQVEPGNWLMYFGQNKVGEKFSIHSEVQYRNHTAVPSNIEQLLLRAGLNYHFAPTAFVTGGYGYITSYDYQSEQSAPESKEHRIWQQLIMINNLGRVRFEHRYRTEQRWVNGGYRNRLRYRLMAFVPLNKPKIEKNVLFLGLYDEVFMNTKRTFFDRNRLYGALGYQICDNANIQAGLLHQRVNDFGKWYLQLGVTYNTDLRKRSGKEE